MQDAFTGNPTSIAGPVLPDAAGRAALQDNHRRRLEALARLGEAAVECDLRADTDRDLVLLAEDEVILLEATGPQWAAFGAAIRAFRALTPLRDLADFGFSAAAENPLEEANELLERIGGGVEAWAYAAADRSVYKFYRPREGKTIGSEFGFLPGAESLLQASARLGDYQALLEKLLLLQVLGGMPTEILGVTREGILVVKQSYGEVLPQGEDMSTRLPPALIEIPSRFLRADRDHPRLLFAASRAYLVADLHARNFVRGADGDLHLIDLVAVPWPEAETQSDPFLANWLERVRSDPRAPALPSAPDADL